MQKLIRIFILSYILVSTLVFLLGLNVWKDTLGNYIFNIYTFISYSLLLSLFFRRNYLRDKQLFYSVLSYSLFSVLILNLMFYYHHQSFFQFQSSDEMTYHFFSIALLEMPLPEAIGFILDRYNLDDLGMFLYVSTLYRIVEDTLFVNLINIVLGSVSSILLYRLGKMIMDNKYAFFASLTFFASSFVFRFESSGLKESLFVTLVVASVYHFYNFQLKRKTISLVYSLLTGGLIIMFRPAVLGMLVVSIAIWLLLDRSGSSFKNLIFSVGMVVVFVFLSPSLGNLTRTFTSFEKSVELRGDNEAIIQSGGMVAKSVAVISAFAGPMPNILARVGKENNSLYSTGLFFRVLLSVPFWFGVFFFIKQQRIEYFPLIIFPAISMVALFYIMESFEMRYHMTHLPFVYLVAFGYLSHLDLFDKARRRRIAQRMNVFYIFVLVLIFVWNYRML